MTLRDRVLYRLRLAPFVVLLLFAVAQTTGALGQFGHSQIFSLLFLGTLLASFYLMCRAMTSHRRPLVSQNVVKVETTNPLTNRAALLSWAVCVATLVSLGTLVNVAASDPPLWQLLPAAAFFVLAAICSPIYFFYFHPRLQNGWQYPRGQDLLCKGRVEEGRAVMTRNLRKNRSKQMAWLGASWAYMNSWQSIDALVCAQRALQIKPDFLACSFRAHALAQLGAYAEARNDFTEANLRGPHFDTNNTIGKTLLDEGQVARALDYLEGSAGGGNIIGTFFLAEAYRMGGYDDYATQTYEDLIAGGHLAGKKGRSIEACARARLGQLTSVQKPADDALRMNSRSVIALQGLLFAARENSDGAFHLAQTLAFASPTTALLELANREYAQLVTEPRFQELIAACTRARDNQLAVARQIIGAGA